VVFNPENATDARILKPSTSFSSGYKNPANLIETALAATVNPGASYVYIGSFGNHPTGHMGATDLWHVARTGRYTTGDGSSDQPYQALDSVKDMAEAVEDHDLAPTHMTADVEAGRLALGLMSALDTDSIKGAYLNGLDGISPSASYVRAKLSEDLKSRIHRRGIGDGRPGELTPVNIKEAKKRMPNIYRGLGRVAHLAPLPVLLFPRDDFDKALTTVGFRGHHHLDDLEDHAVYNDMSAALRCQKATITLQFNRESDIHDVEDCKKFGGLVMDNIPSDILSEDRGVRLLIGEGHLDQNTDTPYDRTRVERYAFPDVRHRMAVLAGGAVLDSQVFQLQALPKSA
jgi:hypothetical protein